MTNRLLFQALKKIRINVSCYSFHLFILGDTYVWQHVKRFNINYNLKYSDLKETNNYKYNHA